MKKSKYLILSSLYFDFDEYLTEINYIKENIINHKQTLLDLLRFNDIETIDFYLSPQTLVNFVHLPNSIKTIKNNTFANEHIKYINFSNCTKINIIEFTAFENDFIKIVDLSGLDSLHFIGSDSFKNNKISLLKLPKNIDIIYDSAFMQNSIQYLDLSNLKNAMIDIMAFAKNPLKEIKISNNLNLELMYNDDILYSDKDRWILFVLCYRQNQNLAGKYKYDENEKKWKRI